VRKILPLLSSSWIFLLAGCGVCRWERTLTPEHRDFLSTARYTITEEERAAFLSLAVSERDEFIRDFWQRRDPNPKTEINEFKEDYFKHINQANRLFSAGGAPGWLQDRGRIYILLGPPDSRDTYPQGKSLHDKPLEVWHYGFFPIVFIDNFRTGDYILEPQSAMHITLINEAQMQRKEQAIAAAAKSPFLRIRLRVRKSASGELRVQVTIPYSDISSSLEGHSLKTTLKLSLRITALYENNQKNGRTWVQEKAFPLVFEAKDWRSKYGKDFVLEMPAPQLPKGNYILSVRIVNEADGSQGYREEIFSF
jgi:GWxTD domain-containing protein